MGGKNIIGQIWLGLTGLWLATVVTVSAMTAVLWLTTIGMPMPPDVQMTIREYYAPISFLLWLVFAVRLFYTVGLPQWKSGGFHGSMISFPMHGILFTIVSSMLRQDAQMSWQTFLTVIGVVLVVTVLISSVISKCFR
ncbi:MAG: hypothetical protein LBH54_00880 [Clostridiales bacterium]|jgi:hypothetical protein|nr:hypothetical protein [Clostridiales bacterium]